MIHWLIPSFSIHWPRDGAKSAENQFLSLFICGIGVILEFSDLWWLIQAKWYQKWPNWPQKSSFLDFSFTTGKSGYVYYCDLKRVKNSAFNEYSLNLEIPRILFQIHHFFRKMTFSTKNYGFFENFSSSRERA